MILALKVKQLTKNNMYSIFTTQFDGVTFRWVLEGQTCDKQAAQATVRTLRAGGRNVMIKKDGKKVSWRI